MRLKFILLINFKIPTTTLDVTGADLDTSPSRTSLRPIIKEGSNPWPGHCIAPDPTLWSFQGSFEWLTLSKALEKYSSIRSVCISVPVFLSFRHLKQGIQEFHRKYVLVPADKVANNVVVICRLHYVNTLKQELDGTRSYLETDTDEMSVVNAHLNNLPVKFSVCVNEGQDKLPVKSLPVHHP